MHQWKSFSLWLAKSRPSSPGSRVASLSAVDVKQSSRLGLTWPLYGARLLLSFNVLPNCKFPTFPSTRVSSVRYGLHVGLLWVVDLYFPFSFFKTMVMMLMMNLFLVLLLGCSLFFLFLLKPYSSLWGFWGLCSRGHLESDFCIFLLNVIPPKNLDILKKSCNHIFSASFSLL